MASGVAVSDNAMKAVNNMKVTGATPEETKKSKKAVIFRLSDDQKSIIVDERKDILVGDCDDTEDVFKKLINKLPKDDCRYVLYNATYETHERLREGLVFILWIPESAPMRKSMVYQAIKEVFRVKIVGVQLEYQAKTYEDISDRRTLAAKLGGPTVKTLEGKPV